MSKMTDVQKLRHENLKRIVDNIFKGNQSDFARKLDASHQYLWQLLSGHRAMGERSAREVEEKLGLGLHWLDQDHDDDKKMELKTKVFTIAQMPQELAQKWLQHLRDFDTAHPGSHFEVAVEPQRQVTLAEAIAALRVDPALTFTKIFERKKKGP